MASNAVSGRGAGPHDAHPERGCHRPRAADPGRGRRAAARFASTRASCATGCRASRRRSWSRPPRPSACASRAASTATTASRASDVLEARRFDDEIALCGAPIEDHHAGGDTDWQYVAHGGVYGIPYRCLIPAGIDGLLVAGRCFSSSHDAHASARSMATCMAMGQAAGTAAAMAVRPRPRHPVRWTSERSASAWRRTARCSSRSSGLEPHDRCRRPAGRPSVRRRIRAHRLIVVLRRVEREPTAAARRRARRGRGARSSR